MRVSEKEILNGSLVGGATGDFPYGNYTALDKIFLYAIIEKTTKPTYVYNPTTILLFFGFFIIHY